MRKLQFIIFGLILLFGQALLGNIINILDDYPTIQQGIDASVNGDTVLVQLGTYVENINYNGKNIKVASLFYTTLDTSYISSTIIDGDSLDSVVKFANSEDSTAILTGFTITNGNAYSGGGIRCFDSSPSLENLIIISNSATSRGGGVYCANSSPSLINVTISDNSTITGVNTAGGGIYCINSNTSLENTIINGNSSSYGGGLFCWGNSSLSLTNVMIFDNKAIEGWGLGGGIACKDSSYIYLKNVTIFGNSASGGGGILMADNSSVNFDNDNRCNIYLNYAGFGSDIYSSQPINVIVDTFTVINPTSFHANPIGNFTFDILHGVKIQVNSDLYVSPEGDNSNDGLSWDEPLKTIAFAMSIIQADSLNPHTIHLSSGTYNQNTNGEKFPVSCISYVSLKGSGENETILDANIENTVLYFTHSYDAVIKGITITNGYSYFKGGGMYCYDSNPSLENVMIIGNSTNLYGGGIYCSYYSSLFLLNVTITGNSATKGGGIYYYYSSPSLANVTISNNTAAYGGGIFCMKNSGPNFENVTITGNSASQHGGGICCEYSSCPNFVNCILWNNSPQEVYFRVYGGPNTITISYSDIQGGLDGIVTNNNGTVNWLEGNIDVDPLFVDPFNGDYHLSWTNFPIPDSTKSPCIDAGDPDPQYNDPDGTRNDMGAYYFDQTVGVDDENNPLIVLSYIGVYTFATNLSF